MSRRFRSVLVAVVLAIAFVIGAGPAPKAAAQTSGTDNGAVAINTKDGSSLFRFAFNITRVMGDTVDPTNAAVAYASCTDCTTVAVAIQVVIVEGSPSAFTPTNLALAENVSCNLCVTMADAYQFVVQTTGPVHLTGDGARQLEQVLTEIRDLQNQSLTLDQLQAKLDEYAHEIFTIYSTDLVLSGDSSTALSTTTVVSNGAATTSTTGAVRSSTSTTVGGSTSTSTTTATAPSSTTTSSTATTTTSAP